MSVRTGRHMPQPHHDDDNNDEADTDNEARNKNNAELCLRQGFLFAFYRFSQVERAKLVERVVHLVTKNDYIHVAVVPVWDYELDSGPDGQLRVHRLLASYHAYTAYMGYGFEVQDAHVVLEPQYELVFLPVDDPGGMQDGLSFLQGLRGAGYNYLALPFTLLPRAWKPLLGSKKNLEVDEHQRPRNGMPQTSSAASASMLQHSRGGSGGRSSGSSGSSNSSSGSSSSSGKAHGVRQPAVLQSQPLSSLASSSRLQPSAGRITITAADDESLLRQHQQQPLSRIFCSQLGLMLCYICKALPPQEGLDPAVCLPKELASILRDEAGAVPCAREAVFIENEEENEKEADNEEERHHHSHTKVLLREGEWSADPHWHHSLPLSLASSARRQS